MKTPSLSVAMILMNEQELLPFCFKSLETLVPLIDVVSIVDGGSTDGTLDVIKQAATMFPILLKHNAMPNSFAEQRNLALEGCASHSDWIIHMDADETFTSNLGQLIEMGALDGHDVWDFPKYYTIQDEFHHWLPSSYGPTTRLFKNIGFRYEREIHEYIVYPGQTGWESIHKPGVIGIAGSVHFFDHTHLKSTAGMMDKGTRYQRFRQRSAAAGIPIGEADMWVAHHTDMLQHPENIVRVDVPKALIVTRP